MKHPTAAERDQSGAWAVLLAGGEGTRLQNLALRIEGDSRPKQFSRLYGGRSLLAHTRERLRPVFREDRTLFVVTKAHERFYAEELADVAPSRVVAQPSSRGTGVAVIAALLRVLQSGSDSVVAFFPSDNYVADEAAFAATVRSAVGVARRRVESVVLIGAEPRWPEVEYGWIEPGEPVTSGGRTPVLGVRRFREKPPLASACELMAAGGLWNTFVTVGHAVAFLKLLDATVRPALTRIMSMRGDLEAAYREVAAIDFSKDVLSREPRRLLVMPDAASGWADLGSPDRVVKTLARYGIEPEWLLGMRGSHHPAHATA